MKITSITLIKTTTRTDGLWTRRHTVTLALLSDSVLATGSDEKFEVDLETLVETPIQGRFYFQTLDLYQVENFFLSLGYTRTKATYEETS